MAMTPDCNEVSCYLHQQARTLWLRYSTAMSVLTAPVTSVPASLPLLTSVHTHCCCYHRNGSALPLTSIGCSTAINSCSLGERQSLRPFRAISDRAEPRAHDTQPLTNGYAGSEAMRTAVATRQLNESDAGVTDKASRCSSCAVLTTSQQQQQHQPFLSTTVSRISQLFAVCHYDSNSIQFSSAHHRFALLRLHNRGGRSESISTQIRPSPRGAN